MKKPAKYALCAFVLLIVVDVSFSYFQTSLSNFPHGIRPSRSILESKLRGAFIETVEFTPASVDWNGKRIAIEEGWLEHSSELVFDYVIVPFFLEYRHFRIVEGFEFCFKLTDDSRTNSTDPSPFFVVQGKGSSFMESGGVYWEGLDDLAGFPPRILLTDNWKLDNSRTLELKRASR